MKLKKLSTNIFRQLGVRLIALRGARDRDRDPGLRARAATLPANARRAFNARARVGSFPRAGHPILRCLCPWGLMGNNIKVLTQRGSPQRGMMGLCLVI